MRGPKLSDKLKAAIQKDVDDIDQDSKKQPKLASDEPEHFTKCPNCVEGLDGDNLCQNCAGSGKVIASTQ